MDYDLLKYTIAKAIRTWNERQEDRPEDAPLDDYAVVSLMSEIVEALQQAKLPIEMELPYHCSQKLSDIGRIMPNPQS